VAGMKKWEVVSKAGMGTVKAGGSAS
jgi:hypothetical protein